MIIDDLVAAFADCEGWWADNPKAIPRESNNPMDLIYEQQAGALPSTFPGNTRSFASWKTPQGGIVGAYRQVLEWTAMGYSLRQMCSRQDPGNSKYLPAMQFRLPSLDPDIPILTLIPPLVRHIPPLVRPRIESGPSTK